MRIAALDMGGTAIKWGVWNGERLIAFGECPSLASEGGPVLLERAKEVLREMEPFEAIGISTAGEVDVRTGQITTSPVHIPEYAGMHVGESLRNEFNVPVAVENDANAAALGEFCQGAMRGEPDFILATYGTGIGGAVVEEGKIRHGLAFSAGSFGKIITHPESLDAESIPAGRYESYASTSALVRRVQRVRPELSNGREIFAEKADPAVAAEIRAWVHEIAIGLVTLAYTLSPRFMVLGGGVMQQPELVASISQEVKRFVEPRFYGVGIVPSELGNDAGVIGAAYLAQQLLEAGL